VSGRHAQDETGIMFGPRQGRWPRAGRAAGAVMGPELLVQRSL